MFRKWMHFLLVLPLLVSALSLNPTPVQAAGPALVDPSVVIWCPTSVTLPKAKKDGCTDAFTTVTPLWDALRAKNPAVAGTFWFGKYYNSSVDVNQVWDGSYLPKMQKYPQTFKGGWDGLGTGTQDPYSPTILNGKSFIVNNFLSHITISGFRIEGAASSTCAGGVALCVQTSGNIKANRVEASGSLNVMSGAWFDNSISLLPATVTITNSVFNSNTLHGVTITSKGLVTIANVRAQSNNGRGILVDNRFGSANLVLNGTTTVLDNGTLGLEMYSDGNVTAYHLIAFGNGQTTPDSAGVFIWSQKAVKITGSGKFKGNSGHGLTIDTQGPITARNLTANFNTTGGVYLSTTAPDSVQAVTLTRVNADFSGLVGLEIYADGKVLIKCSGAYSNNSYGLSVKGNANPGAATLTLQGFLAHANTGTGINPNEDITTNTTPVRTPCPS
jgi:Right handed beta helix region